MSCTTCTEKLFALTNALLVQVGNIAWGIACHQWVQTLPPESVRTLHVTVVKGLELSHKTLDTTTLCRLHQFFTELRASGHDLREIDYNLTSKCEAAFSQVSRMVRLAKLLSSHQNTCSYIPCSAQIGARTRTSIACSVKWQEYCVTHAA